METFEKLISDTKLEKSFENISIQYLNWELSLTLKELGNDKYVNVTFPGKVFKVILSDEASYSALHDVAKRLPSINSGLHKGHSFPFLEVHNSPLVASYNVLALDKLRHFIFISGNEIVEILTDSSPAIAIP